MVGGPVIEIGQLARMLADRTEALAAELLPHGRREGEEWVEARRADGGRGDGLRVCLRGAKRGVWAHFGEGAAARGDALDLVAFVLFDGNKSNAIHWARNWLGLGNSPGGADPRARQAAKWRAVEDRAAADAAAAEDVAKRLRQAQAIWLKARPLRPGHPPWDYLAGRGIDLDRLAALGKVPSALRYEPALWNGATRREHPALVAAITTRDGKMAVHRTWLQRDPDGRGWIKLMVDNPRMTLGPYRGGCIRLWRGAAGTPLAKAASGETVCLTEGIEDGLTVALARPAARVLVCVSLSNMAAVALPASVREIVICADNDAPGGPAAAALDKACRFHRARGRGVRVARPPERYKDFNDWARTLERSV